MKRRRCCPGRGFSRNARTHAKRFPITRTSVVPDPPPFGPNSAYHGRAPPQRESPPSNFLGDRKIRGIGKVDKKSVSPRHQKVKEFLFIFFERIRHVILEAAAGGHDDISRRAGRRQPPVADYDPSWAIDRRANAPPLTHSETRLHIWPRWVTLLNRFGHPTFAPSPGTAADHENQP